MFQENVKLTRIGKANVLQFLADVGEIVPEERWKTVVTRVRDNFKYYRKSAH